MYPSEVKMLQAIAGAIAQKPIKVQVSGTIGTAYCDSKNSVIGITDGAPFTAARGFLIHELLHEKYTLPSDWEKVCDLAPYHNIVEDIRINLGWAKRTFVRATEWIFDCWLHLTSQEPSGVWNPTAPSMSFLYRVHHQNTRPAAWDADVETFTQTHLPTILAASSIVTLRPVLEALKALDEKYEASAKPPHMDPPTKPEQPDTSGMTPAQAKKAAKKAQKAMQEYMEASEKYEAQAKAGETPFHEKHDPIVRDPKAPLEEGESSGKSNRTGHMTEGEPAPCTGPVAPSIIEQLRSWRNRVAEALMARDATAPLRNLPRGRLDGTRLHHIAGSTSDRVFTKPSMDRRAVNTAVDILLDISGSTAGQCSHNLGATAFAVAEACSRVPGVQLGMLQFGHRVHRLMPIQPTRMVRLEQATCSSYDHDTETDLAIHQSVADLRIVRTTRRVCIVCTDGALPQPPTLDFAKDMGVELYELHICDDTPEDEPDHNRCYCTPATIHQGLDRLIRTLRIRGN